MYGDTVIVFRAYRPRAIQVLFEQHSLFRIASREDAFTFSDAYEHSAESEVIIVADDGFINKGKDTLDSRDIDIPK